LKNPLVSLNVLRVKNYLYWRSYLKF